MAKESDFLIRYGEPGQPAPPMTKELTQFDTDLRKWLVSAGFSREIGNGLITNIEQVVRATKAMTPEQLESYRMVEHAKMQRIYGNTLNEKLQVADDMINQVEAQHPGLRERVLERIGVGRNALIWNILIGHAECWRARRKGR